jgi:hypothetical protein
MISPHDVGIIAGKTFIQQLPNLGGTAGRLHFSIHPGHYQNSIRSTHL